MKKHKENTYSGVVGVVLILLGALFLANNFDLIPYEVSYYFFNWKGILLVIGLIMVCSTSNKSPGMILISIGTFFITSSILRQEFEIYIRLRDFFWPGVFIVVGIFLMQKERFTQRKKASDRPTDYLHNTNIMGGGEIRLHSDQFKGGRVTAIFGGSNYDMTGSTLAEGSHTIDLFVLFGGFTLVVPSDWDVHQKVTPLFGGVSDLRKSMLSSEGKKTSGKLIIKGLTIFGGVELKNY